jgi:sugar O-acyltransferase (sialic acid O-acetyltransferase NeuD family)
VRRTSETENSTELRPIGPGAGSPAPARPLVIVGSGGLAREVLELVAAANRIAPKWNVVGILDDSPQRQGARIGDTRVLGGTEYLAELDPDVQIVLCTGSTRDYSSRQRLVDRLNLPVARYTALVHPGAALAESTTVGPGSVVMAGVIATADVRLGSHVVVMPAVVFTHDDVVGDFVTIAAGARFAGTVRIESGAYIGAGALIREGVTVGAGSLIGMGAVVLADVPAHQVWAGVPARQLPGR